MQTRVAILSRNAFSFDLLFRSECCRQGGTVCRPATAETRLPLCEQSSSKRLPTYQTGENKKGCGAEALGFVKNKSRSGDKTNWNQERGCGGRRRRKAAFTRPDSHPCRMLGCAGGRRGRKLATVGRGIGRLP